MQELWQRSVNWDKSLDMPMTDKWNDIATDFLNVTMTSMTRLYFPTQTEGNVHTTHLHIFADAGMKAYGALV